MPHKLWDSANCNEPYRIFSASKLCHTLLSVYTCANQLMFLTRVGFMSTCTKPYIPYKYWSCRSSTIHLIYWCSEEISQLSGYMIAWSELVRNNTSCTVIIGKCGRSSHSAQAKFLSGKRLYLRHMLAWTICKAVSPCHCLMLLELELGKRIPKAMICNPHSVLSPPLSNSPYTTS